MTTLPLEKAIFRRRLLRLNILLGLASFALAVFFSITGEYASLAERTAAEALYNKVAIGGLLYAAFSWIFCVMSKPLWFPASSRSGDSR